MFQFATVTDKGSRKINEDSIGVFQNGDNFGCVLCDGLGGHGMGDEASKLVKDVFTDVFYKTKDIKNFLKAGHAEGDCRSEKCEEQNENNCSFICCKQQEFVYRSHRRFKTLFV